MAEDDYPTVPVPELKAHAQGLPYLAYLLAASQEIPVLSTHGSVMVRVPVPDNSQAHCKDPAEAVRLLKLSTIKTHQSTVGRQPEKPVFGLGNTPIDRSS